jgi:replicative DNA helicase
MVNSVKEPARSKVFKPVLVQFSGNKPVELQSKLGNVRAEEGVIGAVLQKPEIYSVLAELLEPGDFSILFNGMVWRTFEVITELGKKIDPLTVADQLEKHDVLDTTRLAALIGRAPEPDNAEVYARMVRNAAKLIRIATAGMQMVELAQDNNNRDSVDDVVDECNKLLFEATEKHIEKPTSALSILNVYSDKVETSIESGNTRTENSVATGFYRWDDHLKGFAPTELTVLAGADGMGKTTLALSIVRNILHRGGRIAYFTLEMTQEETIRALIAMETGIPKDVLRARTLTLEQYGRFVEATGRMGKWGLHVVDEYKTLTPLQLRRRVRALMMQDGVDMVFIDGLWLMESTKAMFKRNEAVNAITRDLIENAQKLHVPICLLHQYSSEVGYSKGKVKVPTEYDLSESAAVRRNAQVIVGMHRESHYKRSSINGTQVLIFKDRNGTAKKGTVIDLNFNRLYTRYDQ